MLLYLADRGRPVSREQLVKMFWASGKHLNLRQELHKLRQLPGADAWLTVGEQIGLRCQAITDSARGSFAEDLSLRGLPDPAVEWVMERRSAFEAAATAADPIRRRLSTRIAALRAADDTLTVAQVAQVLDADQPTVRDLWRAGEGTPPAADRMRLAQLWADAGAHARAAAQWLAAGQTDAAAEAFAAAGHFDQALELALAPKVKTRLFLQALDAAENQTPEALAALLHAFQTHALMSGDPEAMGQARILQARQAFFQGALAQAIDYGEEAMRIAERRNMAALLQDCMPLLGQLYLHTNRRADARRCFERCRDHDSLLQQHIGLSGLGALAGVGGRLEEALALQQEALERARDLGDTGKLARSLVNVATSASQLGRLDVAVARYTEAIDLTDALGLTALHGMAAVNLGYTRILQGMLGAARTAIRAAMRADAGRQVRGLALDARAALEFWVGRQDEAARWSEQAMEHHQTYGNHARVAISAANLQLYQGNLAGVRASVPVLTGLGRAAVAAELLAEALLHCDDPEEHDRLEVLLCGLAVRETTLTHTALAWAAACRGEAVTPPLQEHQATAWAWLMAGRPVDRLLDRQVAGLLAAQRDQYTSKISRLQASLAKLTVQ